MPRGANPLARTSAKGYPVRLRGPLLPPDVGDHRIDIRHGDRLEPSQVRDDRSALEITTQSSTSSSTARQFHSCSSGNTGHPERWAC